MTKFSMLEKLFQPFVTKALAEGKVTTAVTNTGDGVKFTEGIRAVYSKEIEFKAQPQMRFMQFAI